MSNITKIALVDDHTLFRTGLAGLLSQHDGFEVVADVGSGEEFLGMLPSLDVDVVFMDISMPGMDGAETTRRALAERPDLRIVTLSMYGDEHYYTRMMESGASGFLLKDSDIEEVYSAVEVTMAGDSYFSSALLGTLTRNMSMLAVDEPDEDQLSNREVEILVEVCRGLSNQEIADKLFISKRTVDKHRANIMEKTGCKNTANLVVYAIKNHLVDL
ncbi:MAG: response regulator transcription factor [Alistipes sp.]|nr:response regulator transcription factor [Rikenellaceae bacterium]MBQ3234147.1 response regulator transcription factor [Alistipes sp.]MBR2110102.1 response regulator transcription factor [Alistipes sp.]